MMCKPRFSLPGERQKDLPSLFAGIPKRHELSYHGHEHERSDRLAAEEHLRRIEKATEVLHEVTGTTPPRFRAPNLRLNDPVWQGSVFMKMPSETCYTRIRRGKFN